MSLFDSLILDPAKLDVWITPRTDGVAGAGTEEDPYDATPRQAANVSVTSIPFNGQEATVNTAASHGYSDKDVITISGVTGAGAAQFNGTFVIYLIGTTSFKYWMSAVPSAAAGGTIVASKLTFPFDPIMSGSVAGTVFRLGPGTIQTRGKDRWRPKDRQRFVGSGIAVTTLKIVYAWGENNHVIAIGTAYNELCTDVEVCDMTIDCNLPGQPVTRNYTRARLASGAINIPGRHIRVRRVRAINFGTQGTGDVLTNPECFVIMIGGGYKDGNPDPYDAVVEDCIVEKPSENNTRETSCIVLGGTEPEYSGYMTYGRGYVIRNCYVNCEYANGVSSKWIPVDNDKLTFDPVTKIATIIARTPHNRSSGGIVLVSGVWESLTQYSMSFNGAFEINSVDSPTQLTFIVNATSLTVHAKSNIFMGPSFQAFTVEGATAGIIEGNYVRTTARAVYHDFYSTKDLTVRNNFFTDVLYGVQELMSGFNTPKNGASLTWSDSSGTGVATLDAGFPHSLVTGDAVLITSATPLGYNGTFLVSANPAQSNVFTYLLKDDPMGAASTFKFQTVWQEKRLIVENNVMELTAAVDNYGEPTGVYCDGDQAQAPRRFQQIIIRNNVIRRPLNVLDAPFYPYSRGITCTSCENAIIENNVIDVENANPILLRYIGRLRLFGNRNSAGTLLDGFKDVPESAVPDESKAIEDSLLVAF